MLINNNNVFMYCAMIDMPKKMFQLNHQNDVAVNRNVNKIDHKRWTFNYTLGREEIVSKSLEIITGRSWIIHRTSPLFNLKYEEINLKQYGKWMRDRLVRNLKQTGEQEEIQTKFTVVSLSSDSEHESEALQFEVTAIFEEDIEDKSLYEGIFLSWMSENDKDENFTPLSVLLCRGTVYNVQQVNSLLEKLFECRINQLFITQEDMLWLSAFLTTDTRKLNKNLILKFQFDSKDFINVILPIMSVRKLWGKIHDKNSEEVYVEEIEKFHYNLEQHLFEMYSINFSKLKLITINSPSLLLRFNGFFKTFDNNTTLNVLRFLHMRCYLINLTK